LRGSRDISHGATLRCPAALQGGRRPLGNAGPRTPKTTSFGPAAAATSRASLAGNASSGLPSPVYCLLFHGAPSRRVASSSSALKPAGRAKSCGVRYRTLGAGARCVRCVQCGAPVFMLVSTRPTRCKRASPRRQHRTRPREPNPSYSLPNIS